MAEAEVVGREDVYNTRPVGPYDVSDELRPRIDELELWGVY